MVESPHTKAFNGVWAAPSHWNAYRHAKRTQGHALAGKKIPIRPHVINAPMEQGQVMLHGGITASGSLKRSLSCSKPLECLTDTQSRRRDLLRARMKIPIRHHVINAPMEQGQVMLHGGIAA